MPWYRPVGETEFRVTCSAMANFGFIATQAVPTNYIGLSSRYLKVAKRLMAVVART